MSDKQNQIDLLLQRLDSLLQQQEAFSSEINQLKSDILSLQKQEEGESEPEEEMLVESPTTPVLEALEAVEPNPPATQNPPLEPSPKARYKSPAFKEDLEKFIGENLINKIGIIITIIGVAIGAKYSIENDLISPLTRIILGYLTGTALLAVGIRLKKNYTNYSAVLVSGAMTIMYFITFAAYSFYGLMPQALAFGIMVVFTAFTVLAALNYDKQIIALLGLVGAYAVPFLLSDGSGRVAVMFSYMALINVGIMIIAFKKYWRRAFFTAFNLSWLIYGSWYIFNYRSTQHFGLALAFLLIFFLIFYTTIIAHKILQKQILKVSDSIFLLLHAFIFYGIGYALISGHPASENSLGLFTLANALLHFAVGLIVYRQKLANRNLFYLITALVLTFVTMAVPVQLDGNWVTLLWTAEAALLFWLGRTKTIVIYERLSYPLMYLAFFSLLQDWSLTYHRYSIDSPEHYITPLWNIHFLSSLLFVGAFALINVLNRNGKYPSALPEKNDILDIVRISVPVFFLFGLFLALRMEISNYWYQLYWGSELMIDLNEEGYSDTVRNADLRHFQVVWLAIYNIIFASALAWINHKKIKDHKLGLASLVFIVMALLNFLGLGLFSLSELRENYLDQYLSEYYVHSSFNMVIRYIALALVALCLWITYRIIQKDYPAKGYRRTYDFLLHLCALWIASSELLHWLDVVESAQTYKLGLSILWGVYALFVIVLGIQKNRKYLRVGAISLFGITLFKLFFYDISHLNTISKTIVFVSLGILLLIISFLYNKYKHRIADENPE